MQNEGNSEKRVPNSMADSLLFVVMSNVILLYVPGIKLSPAEHLKRALHWQTGAE